MKYCHQNKLYLKFVFLTIKIQLFREMNYKHQVIQSIILLALQKNNDTVSKNLHVHFLYVKPQKSLQYFIIFYHLF